MASKSFKIDMEKEKAAERARFKEEERKKRESKERAEKLEKENEEIKAKERERAERATAKRRATEQVAEMFQPEAAIAIEPYEAKMKADEQARMRKLDEEEEEKLRKLEEKEEREAASASAKSSGSKLPGFLGKFKGGGRDGWLWLLVLFVLFEGISNHRFFLGLDGSRMFIMRTLIYLFVVFIIFFLVFYNPDDLSRSYRCFLIMFVVAVIAFSWPYLFTAIQHLGMLTPALYNVIVSVFHPFLVYLFFVHPMFFPQSPFQKYFIFACFVVFIVFGLIVINAARAGSFDIPWLTPSIEKTNFFGAWFTIIKAAGQPFVDLGRGAYFFVFGKLLGVVVVPSEDGEAAQKQGIAGFIEKRIAFATGSVEEGAKKKLGLLLDELKQTGISFFAGSPVSVYSTLSAETLEGSTINANLLCTLRNKTVEIPADDYIPQKSIEIFEKDYRNVECIFNDVPAGKYKAVMEADFNFETVAYLKSYFIDANTLRQLNKAGIDFFRHYKIQDRNPVAQSTSGPVVIGVGVDKQPFAVDLLVPMQRIPLSIKLSNSWDGYIKLLKEFIIAVPNGLVVGKFYGLKGEIIPTVIKCSELPLNEQEFCDDALYTLYYISSPQKNITSDVRYGAVLEVSDANALLGLTPPAIQYFKVIAHYDYSLKKEKDIKVEGLVE